MPRFAFRLISALLAAVLINGALAVAMALWARLGAPPRPPMPTRTSVDIPFVTTPPPQKKTDASRKRSPQAQFKKATLPALNLPSAISVPIFDSQSIQTPSVVHPLDTEKVFALSDDTILTQDMVDEPPRPVVRTPLRYPKSAEKGGVEGVVEARLLLSADGTVLQVKILSATPPGVFESAARESLARWKFAPATFRGQTLKAWVRQRVVFKLN